MRPWRRATALTVGVLISMTACGSGSDKTSKPTQSPSVAVTPSVAETSSVAVTPKAAVTPGVVLTARNGQPAGTRKETGKFFSMYVPENFEEMYLPADLREKSVPMIDVKQTVAFGRRSSKPNGKVWLVVGPSSMPKGTTLEQLSAKGPLKESTRPKDYTCSTVKWPGTPLATLGQWTGSGAAEGPYRYWTLTALVNDHQIVSLSAGAPEGDFDTADMTKIFETFRPHAGLGPDETSKLERARVQRMAANDTPGEAVTAHSGQPAGTRQATGRFFSMYVPANFRKTSLPLSEAPGEQIETFEAPSSTQAIPVRVGVVADTKSAGTAIEQSYNLQVAKQAQASVKDFTRSTVKWPGAQSAILVQWTEKRRAAGEPDRAFRYWQLVAVVNDHLIVTVVALAPVAEFDSSGLPEVFETFRARA